MVNIEKHISYWKNGAEEDFEVADQLIRSGKIRHGLFFLHLTLEKISKPMSAATAKISLQDYTILQDLQNCLELPLGRKIPIFLQK